MERKIIFIRGISLLKINLSTLKILLIFEEERKSRTTKLDIKKVSKANIEVLI